jgi:hypothetical protein
VPATIRTAPTKIFNMTFSILLSNTTARIITNNRRGSKIDLCDLEYADHHKYQFSGSHGVISTIDYNPRNEDLSVAVLKERGYIQNG